MGDTKKRGWKRKGGGTMDGEDGDGEEERRYVGSRMGGV
jgi:hypothetical protein